ncbi:MAG TPA: lipase family protein [Candidatus Saccharimonadales bacterium]|nr:lipase family protein [Candidatus Saccharimonadales bacterium]
MSKKAAKTPAKTTQKTIKKVKRHLVSYGIVLAILIGLGTWLGITIVKNWHNDKQQNKYQQSIQAFYNVPSPLPSDTPGTLIRSEKITNVSVPNGGTAYRILYVTQTPNGKPSVSSGVAFIPAGEASSGGRKVIAWAHGTLGLGDSCAPSRSDPTSDMDDWLDGAMQRGYIVTATDYAGLGTAGNPYYLVGQSEANDVINSVRAVRNMPSAQASNQYVAWGHSQGGHSALFTATQAASYAPELKLVGVAAAAPAAELTALFAEQYNKTVAWAIGPDTAVSWPNIYPHLEITGILTSDAQRQYNRLAYTCLHKQGLGLAIRNTFKSQFFASNPMQNSDWAKAAAEQTPDVSKITVPMFISQGLNDVVVLPDTTALLVQKSCAAGKLITADWMGNVQHQYTATSSGPSVMAWIQDRFNGKLATSTCDQPLPLQPASSQP